MPPSPAMKNTSPPVPHRTFWQPYGTYALAAALALGATGMGWALATLLDFPYPILPVVLAALLASLRGVGPAALTIGLGLIIGLLIMHRLSGGLRPLDLAQTAGLVVVGGVIIWVTARRMRSERALATALEATREAEARYAATVESAVDAIVVIDERGVILSANGATSRLFGHLREELVGRNVAVFATGRDAEQHDEYIARYHQSGKAKIIGIGRELVGRRKDGVEFPIELAIGEWRDQQGHRFYTGIMRDISDRKTAETNLARSQERLSKLSRLNALSTVTSTIGHELNQPLTAAGNYVGAAVSRLSGRGTAEREIIGILRRASEQLHRANEILRRVRNFAVSGRVERRAESLHLLLRQAWARVPKLAKDVRLELDIAVDADCVAVDTVQIEQVLLNLLRNAVEALIDVDDPAVHVCARAMGEFSVVRVIDNGPGIPREQVGDLFVPFGTTKSGGSGLGLPICRTIIEAHGGEIAAKIRDNGAEISFTLPHGRFAAAHAEEYV